MPFGGGEREELLKLGGGGGHFRIDARQALDTRSPVSWIMHRFILPLAVPRPLLCAIEGDVIAIRHLLTRGGRTCHPADIAWILSDMRTRGRCHATLKRRATGLEACAGISCDDNAYEIDLESG